MNTRFIFNRFISLWHINILVLAFLWTLGLLIGTVLASMFSSEVGSLFLCALSDEPKPFCVLLINVIPILIVAVALYYRVFAICLPIFLIKAIGLSFCAMLTFMEFTSGAWAIRFLFLFSGSCVSILMWWLVLRHRTDQSTFFAKDIWFAAVISCLISLVDIYGFAPVLIRLSKYF